MDPHPKKRYRKVHTDHMREETDEEESETGQEENAVRKVLNCIKDQHRAYTTHPILSDEDTESMLNAVLNYARTFDELRQYLNAYSDLSDEDVEKRVHTVLQSYFLEKYAKKKIHLLFTQRYQHFRRSDINAHVELVSERVKSDITYTDFVGDTMPFTHNERLPQLNELIQRIVHNFVRMHSGQQDLPTAYVPSKTTPSSVLAYSTTTLHPMDVVRSSVLKFGSPLGITDAWENGMHEYPINYYGGSAGSMSAGDLSVSVARAYQNEVKDLYPISRPIGIGSHRSHADGIGTAAIIQQTERSVLRNQSLNFVEELRSHLFRRSSIGTQRRIPGFERYLDNANFDDSSSFREEEDDMRTNVRNIPPHLYLMYNSLRYGEVMNGDTVCGTVKDARLGPTSLRGRCYTCGLTRSEGCKGHSGHLRLDLPLFNPSYSENLHRILNCLCPHCGRIPIPLMSNVISYLDEEAKKACAHTDRNDTNTFVRDLDRTLQDAISNTHELKGYIDDDSEGGQRRSAYDVWSVEAVMEQKRNTVQDVSLQKVNALAQLINSVMERRGKKQKEYRRATRQNTPVEKGAVERRCMFCDKELGVWVEGKPYPDYVDPYMQYVEKEKERVYDVPVRNGGSPGDHLVRTRHENMKEMSERAQVFKENLQKWLAAFMGTPALEKNVTECQRTREKYPRIYYAIYWLDTVRRLFSVSMQHITTPKHESSGSSSSRRAEAIALNNAIRNAQLAFWELLRCPRSAVAEMGILTTATAEWERKAERMIQRTSKNLGKLNRMSISAHHSLDPHIVLDTMFNDTSIRGVEEAHRKSSKTFSYTKWMGSTDKDKNYKENISLNILDSMSLAPDLYDLACTGPPEEMWSSEFNDRVKQKLKEVDKKEKEGAPVFTESLCSLMYAIYPVSSNIERSALQSSGKSPEDIQDSAWTISLNDICRCNRMIRSLKRVMLNIRKKYLDDEDYDNYAKLAVDFSGLVGKMWMDMQRSATFIYNPKLVVMPREEDADPDQQGIRQITDGKEGRVRRTMSGRRTGQNMTNVISPDMSLPTGSFGLPFSSVRKLFMFERVTRGNIRMVRRIVERQARMLSKIRTIQYGEQEQVYGQRALTAESVYPLVTHLMRETPGGKKGKTYPWVVYRALEGIPSYMRELETNLSIDEKFSAKCILDMGDGVKIAPGDWVLRHVMDGDALFINRAPTLHAMSEQGGFAKIGSGTTIQMNTTSAGLQNADYDGDQEAAQLPSGVHARHEIGEHMNVRRNIVPPGKYNPGMHVLWEAMISALCLSRSETYLSRDDMIRYTAPLRRAYESNQYAEFGVPSPVARSMSMWHRSYDKFAQVVVEVLLEDRKADASQYNPASYVTAEVIRRIHANAVEHGKSYKPGEIWGTRSTILEWQFALHIAHMSERESKFLMYPVRYDEYVSRKKSTLRRYAEAYERFRGLLEKAEEVNKEIKSAYIDFWDASVRHEAVERSGPSGFRVPSTLERNWNRMCSSSSCMEEEDEGGSSADWDLVRKRVFADKYDVEGHHSSVRSYFGRIPTDEYVAIANAFRRAIGRYVSPTQPVNTLVRNRVLKILQQVYAPGSGASQEAGTYISVPVWKQDRVTMFTEVDAHVFWSFVSSAERSSRDMLDWYLGESPALLGNLKPSDIPSLDQSLEDVEQIAEHNRVFVQSSVYPSGVFTDVREMVSSEATTAPLIEFFRAVYDYMRKETDKVSSDYEDINSKRKSGECPGLLFAIEIAKNYLKGHYRFSVHIPARVLFSVLHVLVFGYSEIYSVSIRWNIPDSLCAEVRQLLQSTDEKHTKEWSRDVLWRLVSSLRTELHDSREKLVRQAPSLRQPGPEGDAPASKSQRTAQKSATYDRTGSQGQPDIMTKEEWVSGVEAYLRDKLVLERVLRVLSLFVTSTGASQSGGQDADAYGPVDYVDVEESDTDATLYEKYLKKTIRESLGDAGSHDISEIVYQSLPGHIIRLSDKVAYPRTMCDFRRGVDKELDYHPVTKGIVDAAHNGSQMDTEIFRQDLLSFVEPLWSETYWIEESGHRVPLEPTLRSSNRLAVQNHIERVLPIIQGMKEFREAVNHSEQDPQILSDIVDFSTGKLGRMGATTSVLHSNGQYEFMHSVAHYQLDSISTELRERTERIDSVEKSLLIQYAGQEQYIHLAKQVAALARDGVELLEDVWRGSDLISLYLPCITYRSNKNRGRMTERWTNPLDNEHQRRGMAKVASQSVAKSQKKRLHFEQKFAPQYKDIKGDALAREEVLMPTYAFDVTVLDDYSQWDKWFKQADQHKQVFERVMSSEGRLRNVSSVKKRGVSPEEELRKIEDSGGLVGVYNSYAETEIPGGPDFLPPGSEERSMLNTPEVRKLVKVYKGAQERSGETNHEQVKDYLRGKGDFVDRTLGEGTLRQEWDLVRLVREVDTVKLGWDAYENLSSTKIKWPKIGESLVIEDGELLHGVLDKRELGGSGKGLVRIVYDLYGSERAMIFIDMLHSMLLLYAGDHAWGYGIEDDILNEATITSSGWKYYIPPGEPRYRDAKKYLMLFFQSALAAMSLSLERIMSITEQDYRRGIRTMKRVGIPVKESILRQINSNVLPEEHKYNLFHRWLDDYAKKYLDRFRERWGWRLLPMMHGRTVDASSSLAIMIEPDAGGAGSKGSLLNMTQVSMMVGQQKQDDQRIHPLVGERASESKEFRWTLFTKKGSFGLRERGFISQGLSRGLDPLGLIMLSYPTRVACVQKGHSVSISGTVSRDASAAQSSQVVFPDGSVRDSRGNIVQQVYGYSGDDPVLSPTVTVRGNTIRGTNSAQRYNRVIKITDDVMFFIRKKMPLDLMERVKKWFIDFSNRRDDEYRDLVHNLYKATVSLSYLIAVSQQRSSARRLFTQHAVSAVSSGDSVQLFGEDNRPEYKYINDFISAIRGIVTAVPSLKEFLNSSYNPSEYSNEGTLRRGDMNSIVQSVREKVFSKYQAAFPETVPRNAAHTTGRNTWYNHLVNSPEEFLAVLVMLRKEYARPIAVSPQSDQNYERAERGAEAHARDVMSAREKTASLSRAMSMNIGSEQVELKKKEAWDAYSKDPCVSSAFTLPFDYIAGWSQHFPDGSAQNNIEFSQRISMYTSSIRRALSGALKDASLSIEEVLVGFQCGREHVREENLGTLATLPRSMAQTHVLAMVQSNQDKFKDALREAERYLDVSLEPIQRIDLIASMRRFVDETGGEKSPETVYNETVVPVVRNLEDEVQMRVFKVIQDLNEKHSGYREGPQIKTPLPFNIPSEIDNLKKRYPNSAQDDTVTELELVVYRELFIGILTGIGVNRNAQYFTIQLLKMMGGKEEVVKAALKDLREKFLPMYTVYTDDRSNPVKVRDLNITKDPANVKDKFREMLVKNRVNRDNVRDIIDRPFYNQHLLLHVCSELSLEKVCWKNKLSRSQFKLLLSDLFTKFTEAKVTPYSSIGIISAQVIVEPVTQSILNLFKFVGESKGTSGAMEVREMIMTSKNERNQGTSVDISRSIPIALKLIQKRIDKLKALQQDPTVIGADRTECALACKRTMLNAERHMHEIVNLCAVHNAHMLNAVYIKNLVGTSMVVYTSNEFEVFNSGAWRKSCFQLEEIRDPSGDAWSVPEIMRTKPTEEEETLIEDARKKTIEQIKSENEDTRDRMNKILAIRKQLFDFKGEQFDIQHYGATWTSSALYAEGSGDAQGKEVMRTLSERDHGWVQREMYRTWKKIFGFYTEEDVGENIVQRGEERGLYTKKTFADNENWVVGKDQFTRHVSHLRQNDIENRITMNAHRFLVSDCVVRMEVSRDTLRDNQITMGEFLNGIRRSFRSEVQILTNYLPLVPTQHMPNLTIRVRFVRPIDIKGMSNVNAYGDDLDRFLSVMMVTRRATMSPALVLDEQNGSHYVKWALARNNSHMARDAPRPGDIQREVGNLQKELSDQRNQRTSEHSRQRGSSRREADGAARTTFNLSDQEQHYIEHAVGKVNFRADIDNAVNGVRVPPIRGSGTYLKSKKESFEATISASSYTDVHLGDRRAKEGKQASGQAETGQEQRPSVYQRTADVHTVVQKAQHSKMRDVIASPFVEPHLVKSPFAHDVAFVAGTQASIDVFFDVVLDTLLRNGLGVPVHHIAHMAWAVHYPGQPTALNSHAIGAKAQTPIQRATHSSMTNHISMASILSEGGTVGSFPDTSVWGNMTNSGTGMVSLIGRTKDDQKSSSPQKRSRRTEGT